MMRREKSVRQHFVWRSLITDGTRHSCCGCAITLQAPLAQSTETQRIENRVQFVVLRMWAAFSPMRTAGMLVLPLTMSGNTEASAIRSFFTPCTLKDSNFPLQTQVIALGAQCLKETSTRIP